MKRIANINKTARLLSALSSAGIFLTLTLACNLARLTPAPLPTDTPSQTIPPSTPTPITPTATLDPLIAALKTLTAGAMTATATPVFIPTATQSPSPVTITVENTRKGNILTVTRSTDDIQYQIGPIAEGVFAIGPNSQFFVYCSYAGNLYVARIGDAYLTPLGSIKEFTALRKNTQPVLELRIFWNNNLYRVQVKERNYGQDKVFVIPKSITGP